jgi:hypothetical protein
MRNKLCHDCKDKQKRERPENCDECKRTEKYCKYGYPKDYSDNTDLSGVGYAKLKRPKGEQVTVGKRTVDNSMMVAHSPYLVKLTGSHVNVEIVNTIKSIKYIHKYIHKGYDAAIVDMVKVDEKGAKLLIYDEINRHLDARYVGSI